MSLLLATAAAGAAAFWASGQVNPNNVAEPVSRKIPLEEHWTGRYGEIADLGQMQGLRDQIIAVRDDRDLTGMPCRWIYLRNGAAYRTYNFSY